MQYLSTGMTLVGDNTLAEHIWIYQGMISKQRSIDAQQGVLGARTLCSACTVCVGLRAGLPEGKPYGYTWQHTGVSKSKALNMMP